MESRPDDQPNRLILCAASVAGTAQLNNFKFKAVALFYGQHEGTRNYQKKGLPPARENSHPPPSR
jgi:hypothetical protein